MRYQPLLLTANELRHRNAMGTSPLPSSLKLTTADEQLCSGVGCHRAAEEGETRRRVRGRWSNGTRVLVRTDPYIRSRRFRLAAVRIASRFALSDLRMGAAKRLS